MLTLEQIKAAHNKVKSGADFPGYIKELKSFGLACYETYVTDGHTDFYGANDHKITSEHRYAAKTIADQVQKEEFQHQLSIHQQGETDYPTFCDACANYGVAKWMVRLEEMTCTYYDADNRPVLVETIPTT